jgi:Cytochrome P460
MERKSKITIAVAAAALAVLVARVIYAQEHATYQATARAQDKYSLTTSSGIAFADFKGYEDWSVVSSAWTDQVLKVIVANPTMINAYKADVPGNGQSFPDGSSIAKLQWKFK